jgi:hypothetical protein
MQICSSQKEAASRNAYHKVIITSVPVGRARQAGTRLGLDELSARLPIDSKAPEKQKNKTVEDRVQTLKTEW